MRWLIFSLIAGLFPVASPVAAPVISEIMASNKDGLKDEDGDRPDWVEIHNPDADPVSLNNWSLTDNASNPRKWVFPDVTIPAGGYLLVYCSSKNRRVVGRNLHTSFALSAEGEYLALIKPDGTRVSEFSPAFPPQYEDISWGPSSSLETVTLVAKGSPVRAFVPSNDALGSSWLEQTFSDEDWLAGTLGAGFFNRGSASNPDLSAELGLDLSAHFRGEAGVYLRIPFSIADPAKVRSLRLRMFYDDAFVAYMNGPAPVAVSRNAPTIPDFSSLALWSRPANIPEDFDLAGQIPRLVAGMNVLAVQGLNATAADSDLFILPVLVATIDTGIPSVRGYFPVPTPGAVNGGPGDQRLPQTVTFSRHSGPFTAGFLLTLSGAIAGQEIRYEIADPSASPGADLPEPTKNSRLYAGPISIEASKLIRAAVFNSAGGQRGLATTAQFLLLETGASANTSNFQSRLPILVADDHGAGQPVDSSFGIHTTSMLYLFEPVNGTASLTSPPTVATRAGLRVRGSSSAGFPKKSYGLETWDERNEDLKMPLLGLSRESDWILNGPWYYDDAYIRNALFYEVSRQIGRWAPRTRFVEMFTNTNGGKLDYADYAGLYVLSEKIESGGGRLDITGIEPTDGAGETLTGGYVLKIDRPDSNEVNWTTTQGVPVMDPEPRQRLILVEPDPDEDTAEQIAFIKGYVQEFTTRLFSEAAASFATRTYRDFIDVPSFVDHHILNSLAMNVDGLGLSAFFHMDRGERLQAGPVWDFDRSAGSDDPRDDIPQSWGTGTYYYKYFDRDWWGRLFRDPDFVQAWIDRWSELREGPLASANLNAIADNLGAQIGNVVGARDAARWPDNAATGGTYLNEIGVLKSWLTSGSGHAPWIDSQMPARPTANVASGVVSANTPVSLGGAGRIFYTMDGTDPRPPGGAIETTAAEYAAAIRISQTTVLTARRQGTFRAFPAPVVTTNWSAALTRVYLVNEVFAEPPDLQVSEVHYRPEPPTEAERAAVPRVSTNDFQFFEIQNVGNRTVNTFEIQLVDPTFATRLMKLRPLTLKPGESALVVKRTDAFIARYGLAEASRIVGEWGVGSLRPGKTVSLLTRANSSVGSLAFDDVAPPGTSLLRSGNGWVNDMPSPGSSGPTFAQWTRFHFPPGSLGGGRDDDPDLDRTSNVDEYARGSDPKVAEQSGRFEPTFMRLGPETERTYAFTFTRPTDRPSAHHYPEESIDLTNWTPATDQAVSISGNIETRRVVVTIGDEAEPARFFRLRRVVDP